MIARINIKWNDVFIKVISSTYEIGVVVDHDWYTYWKQRFDDLHSDAETLRLSENGKIIEIGQKTNTLKDIQGQYIGLMVFQGRGLAAFCELYEKEQQAQKSGMPGVCESRKLDDLFMTDMLQGLIKEGIAIYEIPIHGEWIEVDSYSDLQLAEKFCRVERDKMIIQRKS